jgi:hypothetical protein
LQTLIISSSRVKWAKQGTCELVDSNPAPPELDGYEAPQGWKEVTGVVKHKGGGDYLFPLDQILQINSDDTYNILKTDKMRNLGELKNKKNYLVWFHHLLPQQDWDKKVAARKRRA